MLGGTGAFPSKDDIRRVCEDVEEIKNERKTRGDGCLLTKEQQEPCSGTMSRRSGSRDVDREMSPEEEPGSSEVVEGARRRRMRRLCPVAPLAASL